MTFDEYLPYANLQLTPEKSAQLEKLYSQKEFEQFNRLLLAASLKGMVPHMTYDNITEILKSEISVLKNAQEVIKEVPDFIADVAGCHEEMTRTGRLTYNGTCIKGDYQHAAGQAQLTTILGNTMNDAIAWIGSYKEGARVSISTFSKDGDEFSETFTSHEAVTKKIFAVLGKELTDQLKWRVTPAREN